MNADETAALIAEARAEDDLYRYPEDAINLLLRLADALELATHKDSLTVRTVEELDALPLGVVVLSSAGTIGCRASETSRGVVFGDDRSFSWLKIALPATVLWSPVAS